MSSYFMTKSYPCFIRRKRSFKISFIERKMRSEKSVKFIFYCH
ncbi:hypothetical protein HMPREF0208_03397 [Citrobacter koseri]|nr:hypothetical protein HMPREF3207_01768 [Citrobacter koseri]KXA03859.1 hypothetical protein HMPREF3220_00466 [Citrobacter koseri]KXB41867.1 hypothetical protein HMPREF0208_03397 [Citrobacter koseri]